MTTIAVVLFPGTNCELDTVEALMNLGAEAEVVWHSEADLDRFDAVVLPGGFAHGDYLRTGAIARFSPVMQGVAGMAAAGRPVLGICNGFQILCEAGLLPGGFIANRDLSFLCTWVDLEVADENSILTAGLTAGTQLRLPLNSFEGNYVASSVQARVVLTYRNNPNGSDQAAAAIANDRGNVVGVMPHPERASADWLGSADGNLLLGSFLQAAAA
ncbi:MAG TPA: phosphoribosylformylglycinamidine synthase subunit PurQ [Acidimicrobiia bacterium]|nr:phosphoribosylformylglycinamidine synthase subunit PurQ [Acidimicrobiia bacterium]